jgi:hypothetical protein
MIFFFLILEEMIRTTKIYIAVTRLIVVGLAKQCGEGVKEGISEQRTEWQLSELN